jgi:hypothetical protein
MVVWPPRADRANLAMGPRSSPGTGAPNTRTVLTHSAHVRIMASSSART